MAKSAAKRAARPPSAKGGMRPVLLAAGLGLFWFVEYQDPDAISDVPMWGYMMTVAVQLFADFVGAWVIVAALQLVLVLARLAVSYLRSLWLQESGG